MTPSCLTCRHSEPTELDPDLALECRRYPPTITFPPDHDGALMAFPQVFEGDWCGEWAPAKETT